jgi:hypothetical protein
MILALTGIALLLILLLVALRTGGNREKGEIESRFPMINTSGIYSIIRRSPRDSISDYKPSQEEIIKYLSDKNVTISGLDGSGAGSTELIKSWNDQMEFNIREIEQGDEKGIEFYFYDYAWNDPLCDKIIAKGRFVTREELYQFPNVIPPFHLGCGCRLRKYEGKEKMRETTEIGMLPLFQNGLPPPLPTWKEILINK